LHFKIVLFYLDLNMSKTLKETGYYTNRTIGELCQSNVTSIYTTGFIYCLEFFFTQSIALTVINSLMVIVSFVANSLVIFFLFKRKNKQTVFDQILISHAFVDMITNSIDLPVYHISLLFEYFPFGKNMCFFHLIVDHSTSTIEISHFIYMSYARLRCILAPRTYLKEHLINYSTIVIVFMWVMCVCFWVPIIYFFNFKFYADGQCFVNYNDNKFLGISTVIIGYHGPLFFTIGTSIFVLIKIGKAKAFSNKSENCPVQNARNRTVHEYLNIILNLIFNNPQVKLSIITLVFTFCYLPYSFSLLLEAACSCVIESLTGVTDLLCFSASMWNPILILILNYKYFTRASNSKYVHK
jgi:hypothetical protein